MITERVYSNVNNELDWHELITDSEFCLEDVGCCDCDEPAMVLTDCGRNRDGEKIVWAQCHGCADESMAQTIDARRQAEYECEI